MPLHLTKLHRCFELRYYSNGVLQLSLLLPIITYLMAELAEKFQIRFTLRREKKIYGQLPNHWY